MQTNVRKQENQVRTASRKLNEAFSSNMDIANTTNLKMMNMRVYGSTEYIKNPGISLTGAQQWSKPHPGAAGLKKIAAKRPESFRKVQAPSSNLPPLIPKHLISEAGDNRTTKPGLKPKPDLK